MSSPPPEINVLEYDYLLNNSDYLAQAYLATLSTGPLTSSQIVNLILNVPVTIAAFFGNLAVLAAFWMERKTLLKTHFNLFLLNLTIIDFLTASIHMPITTVMNHTNNFWPQGVGACAFVVAVTTLVSVMGLVMTAVIAVDRYWAACWSLHYRCSNTRARALAINAMTWCACLSAFI